MNIKDVSDNIVAQLEANFNQNIPLLPKAFNRVLAKAVGAAIVLLYRFAGFILLQRFVQTAADKEITVGGITINPLGLLGSEVGLYKRLAQRAELEISIPVITQTGTLTNGTRFINNSTGMIYTLIADVPLNAGTVTGEVRAVSGGVLGNLDIGATLEFMSPLASVMRTVTITDVLQDGTDEETTTDFRKRVHIRYASRPQGGAYADYWDWGMNVPGVKNIYPYSGWDIAGLPNSGSGTVVVFVESLTGTDGIPSAALREDVLEAIQGNDEGLASVRPINAYTDLTLVRPISRTTFDVTITGLLVENEADVKTEIEEAIAEYFADREPWITGLHMPPRKDTISTMELMGVIAGTVAVYSGIVLNVQISTDSAVIPLYYMLQEGEKAKLGVITWA